MRRLATFMTFGLVLLLLSSPGLVAQSDKEKRKEEKQRKQRAEDTLAEEQEDYYKKWLEEDVRYIISDEEKSVFSKLTTPEERDNFVEQFWFRRDTDPRTIENEFKEEHYRRIAYANEKFASGDPGWVTDRGRAYIIHGPPSTIESRPDGGAYFRPIQEGGGVTGVFPFEKWFYTYIEGLGPNVEMEFIDPTWTGQFKLAVFDWEKDALTFSAGSGRTEAEISGLATRAEREAINPASGGAMYGAQSMYRNRTDTPFRRYERAARSLSNPITQFTDLKELIEVDISYEMLPFEVEQEFFQLNDQMILAPITIRVRNKDLTFKAEGDVQRARIGIYGMVSTMTNRFVMEFEQDVDTSFLPGEMARGLDLSSVYQKVIPIKTGMLHKVDLVVKDLNSGHTGTKRQAIRYTKNKSDDLFSSSLLLSGEIEALGEIPQEEEMFVIGDVRVLPNLDNVFTDQMPLGVYFHVYNAAVDQTSFAPALDVTYSLSKNGKLLRQLTDSNGESTQFFSPQRVVMMRKLSLQGLAPGRYQLEIEVLDKISDKRLELKSRFRVEADDARVDAARD